MDNLDRHIREKLSELENHLPEGIGDEISLWEEFNQKAKPSKSHWLRVAASISLIVGLSIGLFLLQNELAPSNDIYGQQGLFTDKEWEAISYLQQWCGTDECGRKDLRALSLAIYETNLQLLQIQRNLESQGNQIYLMKSKSKIEFVRAQLIKELMVKL